MLQVLFHKAKIMMHQCRCMKMDQEDKNLTGTPILELKMELKTMMTRKKAQKMVTGLLVGILRMHQVSKF